MCNWYDTQKDYTKFKDDHLIRLEKTDLRVSSLQCGFFSPINSNFTPESYRLLLFRSSSLRLEDCKLRTEDRAAQLASERLQTLSLKRQ